ncbi:hypothetical protein LguiB_010800 [Lonicera macranthoides]
MPKNKGKGGKNRKRGKNEAHNEQPYSVCLAMADVKPYVWTILSDCVILAAYGELPDSTRLSEGPDWQWD